MKGKQMTILDQEINAALEKQITKNNNDLKKNLNDANQKNTSLVKMMNQLQLQESSKSTA